MLCHALPCTLSANVRQGRMMMLRGDAAIAAGYKLLQTTSLCVVVPDPKCGPRVAPRLLALAGGGQSLVIDVAHTPRLSEFFSAPVPFAAGDAKRVHHGLVAAGIAAPARWACACICEQLLLGAQAPETTPKPQKLASQAHIGALTAAAQRFGIVLPDVAQGLDALEVHARRLGTLLAQQSQALLQKDMRSVSRIEAAAVAPIGEMEARGMPFAAQRWRYVVGLDEAERAQLAAWTQNALGQADLNIENEAHLLRALAAVGQKPASARKNDLSRLPAPWGANLARLRDLTQRHKSWGLGFLEHVGPNGRIYPTFAQIGASTGRMACHTPNVQAIPRAGSRRACFQVTEHRSLVIADYQGCELRILAHLSEDAAFIAAFARGEDVHAEVATQLFGTAGGQAEHAKARQVAKVVSFGLIYGMGPRGLARTLNIGLHEAQRLQTQYFATFPQVRAYLMESQATAMRRGYAVTVTGRRLWVQPAPGTVPNPATRAASLRMARNMPIQGTNADLIKLVLARLRLRWGQNGPIGVINCVHDEIMVECPRNAAHEVGQQLGETMVTAAQELIDRVPMTVHLQTSQAWGASTS